MVYLFQMVIFYSYVKLPEGILAFHRPMAFHRFSFGTDSCSKLDHKPAVWDGAFPRGYNMTFGLNMVDGISSRKNTPPCGSMIFPALSHHLVWSPFLAFEALDFAEGASLWEVVGRAAGRSHGHVHVQTRYSESHPPVVCTQLHWAQAYMSLAVFEKRDSGQGRCAGIHKCLGCRTGWKLAIFVFPSWHRMKPPNPHGFAQSFNQLSDLCYMDLIGSPKRLICESRRFLVAAYFSICLQGLG